MPQRYLQNAFKRQVYLVLHSNRLPSLKPDDWYTSNGYVSGGQLTSGMKVYANSYSSTEYRPSATNVVIVAKSVISQSPTLEKRRVWCVLCSKWKGYLWRWILQGLILSQDGFFVTSGGTDVIFKVFRISSVIPMITHSSKCSVMKYKEFLTSISGT